MIIMRVGDPHVKPNNIDESDALMNFVNDMILEHRPDRVELLGDLFHTHSILRLECIDFWDAWLDTLSEAAELIVLVGNHDQSGDYASNSHALSVFKHMKKRNLKIIDLPRVEGNVGYMPYFHDHARFIELANGLKDFGAKYLVCHQTFQKAKYESGIEALDGIDSKLLNYSLIISGHIHSTQSIVSETQTIIYPGTAKWDTAADANEDKGIWLYEHDENGAIISTKMLSTAFVCTPIVSVVWNEGEEMPTFPERAKASIELIGSGNWVTKQKAALKGKFSVKTKVTDKVNKEARQAGSSFLDFLMNKYNPTIEGMNREQLLTWAKELGIV